MDKQNCTMLVSSCDKNEDTWLPFFMCLEKYWPRMKWPIVLNTEAKSYSYRNLNIKTFSLFRDRQDKWSQRLRETLERIDTDFVFFILDDFFITKQVDHDFISKTINYMESNSNIAVFSFHPVHDERNIYSLEYPNFEKRPVVGGDYKLNCQAAMWRKDRLIKMLKDDESPWDFEIYGSIRISYYKDEFYTLAENAAKPIEYNMRKNGTGLVRGKWSRSVVEPLFEELGLIIDFSKRGFIPDNYFDSDSRTFMQKINTKFKKLEARILSLYYVIIGLNRTH